MVVTDPENDSKHHSAQIFWENNKQKTYFDSTNEQESNIIVGDYI